MPDDYRARQLIKNSKINKQGLTYVVINGVVVPLDELKNEAVQFNEDSQERLRDFFHLKEE